MPTTQNPTHATDTIAILNNNSVQVFANAYPIRLSVLPSTAFMIHPVEQSNGLKLITDQTIILPIEISIDFILNPENYRDTYQQIYNAHQSRTPFFVQTRARTYPNMFIESYPHEENSRIFDTIGITITFKEVLFKSTSIQQLSSNDVLNPSDESTATRGEQAPTTVSPEQAVEAEEELGFFYN